MEIWSDDGWMTAIKKPKDFPLMWVSLPSLNLYLHLIRDEVYNFEHTDLVFNCREVGPTCSTSRLRLTAEDR